MANLSVSGEQKGGFKRVKPQVEITIDGDTKTETKKYNGKITTVSVWTDLNGDGEFSSNELTKVTQYGSRFDEQGNKLDGYRSDTYMDTDHDGYDDYKITREYDEDGNRVRMIKRKTGIVKKGHESECQPYDVINSSMETHRSGNYVFSVHC